MLVSCKNAKSGSRAFKRTNSEVFSIKTRWERPIWKFEIFTDFHFFLKKIEIFDKITKNHRISNWSVSANFYRKHFRVGAFERPWPIWSGKTKSFCINRIKPPVNRLKPMFCMVTRFCPFLFLFRLYRGLRRFNAVYAKTFGFSRSNWSQGLSNAPTLKCFR